MDKSAVVKSALKATKSKSKAQDVKIVNTPTVKVAYDEPKPYRETPTLRLNSLDLSAIKNWKVGSKYKLELEVEMTSMSQGNEYDMVDRPDKSTRATFKVQSVKAS